MYGIATFPAKYDKSGGLVRKYCPELAKFPDKFIYAPHTAPMEVQKKAGCIIGKDYPFPILDEKEEKARCLNRCKAAYDVRSSIPSSLHYFHQLTRYGRSASTGLRKRC